MIIDLGCMESIFMILLAASVFDTPRAVEKA